MGIAACRGSPLKMSIQLSLIGYGEAGRTFARAANWRADARAFDIRPLKTLYEEDGITPCDDLEEAVRSSEIVLSLVTADQSLNVANHVAQSIEEGCLFFDMNSVAPQTKLAAEMTISRQGGKYVDVAILAPVSPAQLAVPLAVSGPVAADAASQLTALGFANVRVVGNEVGQAATIKMLRSVMYKGMEALTAECLMACERAGLTQDVIDSFGAGDWSEQADYRLDRMLIHGERRSAEMREAAKTLEGLGIVPEMTRGTIAYQKQIGAKGKGRAPAGLGAKLKVIGQ